MVYQERNTWATLIATIVTTTVYVVIILGRMATTPIAEIDWVTPLLWTLGVSIVGCHRPQHRARHHQRYPQSG